MPSEAIQMLIAWNAPISIAVVNGFADRECPHCPNISVRASLGEPCDECKVGIYREMRDAEYQNSLRDEAESQARRWEDYD